MEMASDKGAARKVQGPRDGVSCFIGLRSANDLFTRCQIILAQDRRRQGQRAGRLHPRDYRPSCRNSFGEPFVGAEVDDSRLCRYDSTPRRPSTDAKLFRNSRIGKKYAASPVIVLKVQCVDCGPCFAMA